MTKKFKVPAAAGVFSELGAYKDAQTPAGKVYDNIMQDTQDTQVTQQPQHTQDTQHTQHTQHSAEIKTRRVSVVLTPTTYQDAADLAYIDRRSFNSLVCELIEKHIKANRGKLEQFKAAAGGKA